MAVWRKGVTGALADNAVDMTYAWTTLPRRPHAHRDNCNSNRRLKWRDQRGWSWPAFQSRTMVQWSRRRGPLQTIGGVRQTKFRGLDRVRMAFTFALAAYNLVRLPKLVGKTA